jgi:hypothetical protein
MLAFETVLLDIFARRMNERPFVLERGMKII